MSLYKELDIPMTTKEQLDSFYHFAAEHVDDGGAEPSLDELYAIWRARNPSAEELNDNVAAIQAACDDLEAGDTGRPYREVLRDICADLGIVTDE